MAGTSRPGDDRRSGRHAAVSHADLPVGRGILAIILSLTGRNMTRLLAASLIASLTLCAPSAFADLKADSPVTFPKEGALPAKYPPDEPDRDATRPEKDYYLSRSPERSLAQIAKIRGEMPEGRFTPPPHDWAHLRRTRRVLAEGGELRLLAVGDSIVADTMRSGWVAKLREAYPKARIEAKVYVRGGGGCQHYKEEGRVAKVIVPLKPDLVLIGGISQRDVASTREVIRQIRSALPEVEILLFSGTFGTADPRVPDELSGAAHSGTGDYGRALKALAAEERCAYLDMTTPWAEYLRSAKVHPHRFYRDAVHANEYGEQVLSKILMAFWEGAGDRGRAGGPAGPAVGR
jgi:lysophospholipase L1-like esterase